MSNNTKKQSTAGQKKEKVTISVELDRAEMDALTGLAEKWKRSKSNAVRWMIDHFAQQEMKNGAEV